MNTNATIRFVVFDLLNDLKQVYDDAQLTPFKVFYWVMIHADRLRKQHIEKIDSGAYVTKFDVAVSVDPKTGRNYFELPAAIYDFDKDAGVDYITYPPEFDLSLPVFASTTFTRTTPGKAARLYFREDEKPTPANPYFYRQNSKIWLLGTEQININFIEVGLKASLGVNDPTIDIDQPLDLPQDLLPTLKRQILDMGRFVLMIPRDLANDGASFDNKNMPTNKIVSVNDMNQTNQQE
jgi:hypothetical protein